MTETYIFIKFGKLYERELPCLTFSFSWVFSRPPAPAKPNLGVPDGQQQRCVSGRNNMAAEGSRTKHSSFKPTHLIHLWDRWRRVRRAESWIVVISKPRKPFGLRRIMWAGLNKPRCWRAVLHTTAVRTHHNCADFSRFKNWAVGRDSQSRRDVKGLWGWWWGPREFVQTQSTIGVRK